MAHSSPSLLTFYTTLCPINTRLSPPTYVIFHTHFRQNPVFVFLANFNVVFWHEGVELGYHLGILIWKTIYSAFQICNQIFANFIFDWDIDDCRNTIFVIFGCFFELISYNRPTRIGRNFTKSSANTKLDTVYLRLAHKVHSLYITLFILSKTVKK